MLCAVRFPTAMKKWLRPSMMVMALLALFASALPALSWACPVTGRIGEAATVCNRLPANKASAAMPCCAKRQAAGKSCLVRCCKEVPQPSGSDKEKNTAPTLTHADTLSVLAQLSQGTRPTPVAFTPPCTPLVIEPSSRFAPRDADCAPLPLSQSAPAAFAGRAPPIS